MWPKAGAKPEDCSGHDRRYPEISAQPDAGNAEQSDGQIG
jgi:hypothetical protein